MYSSTFLSKVPSTISIAALCGAFCSRGGAVISSWTPRSAVSHLPVWGTLLMVKWDTWHLFGDNICSSWGPVVLHDDPAVRVVFAVTLHLERFKSQLKGEGASRCGGTTPTELVWEERCSYRRKRGRCKWCIIHTQSTQCLKGGLS